MILDVMLTCLVDQTSVNTKMVRLHGCSLRGTRLIAVAPVGHWGTQTFIAGCAAMASPRLG
ncbi:hypothetical protein [Ensifer aridi]|uniref:hypothetical protein n=1 Tax=Ensifer aridi TaxID=1708715 RepID=UPI00040FC9DC|nr:hypothetical protein [Ensifer aridi]